MKALLYSILCLSSLLIFSCEDNTEKPSESEKKDQNQNSLGINFSPTGEVGNSKKRVKRVIRKYGEPNPYNVYYDFHYNSEGLMDSVLKYNEGTNIDYASVIDIAYQNGKLSSIKNGHYETVYDSIHDFSFDNSGNITEYLHWKNGGASPSEVFHYKVSYDTDERITKMSKIEQKTGYDVSATLTYSSDGKISTIESAEKLIMINENDDAPYIFSSVGFIIFYYKSPEYILFKNNPLSYRDKTMQDDWQEDVLKTVSVTYNNDGLVESYKEFSDSGENDEYQISYEDL